MCWNRLDIPHVLQWGQCQKFALWMRPLGMKAVACQRNLWLTDLNRKKIIYANHMLLSVLSQCHSFFFSKKSLLGPFLHHFCSTMMELVRMAYKNSTGSRWKWMDHWGSEKGSFLKIIHPWEAQYKLDPRSLDSQINAYSTNAPQFLLHCPFLHTPLNLIPMPNQAATASTDVLFGTDHFL